ncbi:MAG: hypothetical protein CMH52_00375 [Myxococcales bacterium]|nr:hypothetical protein [Myxococcales bacterium]
MFKTRWNRCTACIFVLGSLVGCAGAEIDSPETEPPISRDAGMRLILDAQLPASDANPASPNLDSGLMDSDPIDVAIEMGDLQCRELSECLADCSDPDCSLACRMAAPDMSTALYDAIFVCASANDCARPGGNYDQMCMTLNCAAEQRACLGPPPPGPPPPMGDLTCQQLDDCLSECVPGDLDCRDTCVSSSSQQGYDQLLIVQMCVETAECEPTDFACILRACEGSLATCYGSVIRPLGDATCDDLNRCLGECSEGETDCFDGCYRSASEAGYNQFRAVVACVGGTQCGDDDGDCQRMACPAEFEVCFGPAAPPPMGMMTCDELNACLGNCAEADQLCINNCIGRSSQMGYDAFLAAVDCIAESNCPEDDAACRQAACQMQIEACLGPPAMPTGNSTCAQLNECLATCMEDDRDCVDSCIRASSPVGFRLLQDAIQCVEDAGCMPADLECQQSNCAAEIQACFSP